MENNSNQESSVEKVQETKEHLSASDYILSTPGNQQEEPIKEEAPQAPEETPVPPSPTNEKNDYIFKRVFFVGIALLLLFIIAFAIIQIIPFVVTSLSGVNSGLSSIFAKKEKIDLTLSQSTVSSGTPFNLTWKGNVSGDGKYIFTYKCDPNYYIEHTYPNNQTVKVICDEPFVLPTDRTTLTFTPFFTQNNGSVDIPIQVGFIKSEATTSSLVNNITLHVEHGKTESGVSFSSTTPATQSKPPTATSTNPRDYYIPKPVYTYHVGDYHWGNSSSPSNTSTVGGKADLMGSNPLVGTVNSQNVFTPGATIHNGDRVSVQFEISNAGTKSTGTWKLSAVLPTSPEEVVISDLQRNLNPGDKMIFTLSFTLPENKKTGVVAVHLDPSNTVSESNENNNTFFITVQ